MSKIVAAVEALDISLLTRLCEEAELTAAENNEVHPFPTFHILSALLDADLSEARFLWKRLPPQCKADAETRAAWALAQALWQRDSRGFFEAAEQQWSKEAGHLVKELVCQKREAAIRHVERGYSRISMERAGATLGLNHSGLVDLCQRQEWVIEDGFILINNVKHNRDADNYAAVQQSELQMLTEQLIKLQTTS